MMLKFGVAKELGKTLQEIGEMTEQELDRDWETRDGC